MTATACDLTLEEPDDRAPDPVTPTLSGVGSRPGRARILANEREALERVLQQARAGKGQALVARGEAGLGKTTLLEHAIAAAPDFLIARVAGVESERDLSYAALQRLCEPMLDHVDRLPGPQRDALVAAFGSRPGTIDRFFVSLAVLGLVSEVSARQPVVCVVDDAQWLDQTSMQVLAFVARRVRTERVALVFAASNAIEALEGLSELSLRGLSRDEARTVLTALYPGRLHARVSDRIVAESRGNLRALRALAHDLTPDQLAGFGLPAAVPKGAPFVKALRSRLEELPVQTKRLLLIAAAEPEGDPALFWRAAARLGIDPGAADDAASLGLLEFGTRVTFCDPDMRSVVYHDARFDERRRVHRALAEMTEPEAAPDRQAWHRGHATLAADEEVADALERSVGHAQASGGYAAAAAFLERSTLLTPDSNRRARRALAAAHAKFEAGSLEAASEMLTVADEGSLDEFARARLERLRANIAFVLRRGDDAPTLLLDAARTLERFDDQLARDTYLQALEAALLAGRLGAQGGLADAATSGRAAPPATTPCASDLLLEGLAVRFTVGYAAAVPTLQQAVQASCRANDTRWLGLACRVASEMWDAEAVLDLATRWIQLSRESGALRRLPVAFNFVAAMQIDAGDFTAAVRSIEDADAISEAAACPPVEYSRMVLAAWRGAEEKATELIDNARQEALARGEGRQISESEYAAAVLYNGLGRYREAFTVLQPAYEYDELGCLVLPELIEAAVRSGEHELAAVATERLTERTEISGTEWALGLRARSLALVTEGPAAEKLYRDAIDRLRRGRASAHLARAHLVYGEWLRRERRRVDAREQLRLAHDMFASMGADAFAARAQRELLATGERARKRTVETNRDLTPQEAEIARLASDGHSNPKIAAMLFISARTVEYHLHKVFIKFGISSRNQLAHTLELDAEPSSS